MRRIRGTAGAQSKTRHWEVQDKANKRVESGKGRSEAFVQEDGWYIMSDGGEPEFVIDHVEEADQKGLAKRVRAAANFAQNLKTKIAHGNHFVPKGATEESKVTADPQVTVGIRYSGSGT